MSLVTCSSFLTRSLAVVGKYVGKLKVPLTIFLYVFVMSWS